MRFLVYAPGKTDTYLRLCRAARPDLEWVGSDEESELRRLLPEVEAALAWKLPSEFWPLAGRLQWVQSLGAGVDDLVKAPLPERVEITRIEGPFGGWMAEYVAAHILAVTQRLREFQAAQQSETWQPLTVRKAAGRKAGVAGLGAIGSEIAHRLTALGLEVSGLNRSGRKPAGFPWPVHPLEGWRDFACDLDFLVMVLPHTTETHHLVDQGALAALPRGAWLINVGRGAVVDTRALVAALEAGQLGGAVLDVFEEEPLPKGHPLWKLPNVVLTPHISGPSVPEEIVPVVLQNVRRFERGEPLAGRVERGRGY